MAYPEWQSLANRLDGDGQIFKEWMQVNNMALTSRPGVPTHDLGNTLDLVRSNTGGLADITPAPEIMSDHHTLLGDVPRINAQAAAVI